MSWAALLLAAALLVGGDHSRVRIRAGQMVPMRTHHRPVSSGDPLAAASSFDVLAACLRSGMAVSTAVAATAPSAPPEVARLLNRAADLLALGADPATAWSSAPGLRLDHHAEALLRLARRSASSGTALAHGVAELAAQSRLDAADAAGAAAERASVLIAGPLGMCYLPAFLCLGIVPVVAGLAGDVLQSGVL
jgi:pilus assembly protein TadC